MAGMESKTRLALVVYEVGDASSKISHLELMTEAQLKRYQALKGIVNFPLNCCGQTKCFACQVERIQLHSVEWYKEGQETPTPLPRVDQLYQMDDSEFQ